MSIFGVVLLHILNFIFGIISLFLALRVVLHLFAASASAPIVVWIYNITDRLISPFQGMFPSIQIISGGALDVVALIALVAYSIVFYIIGGLIRSTLVTTSVRDEEHVISEHA